MEFSVRHFISGRIRLHLPSLCRKRKLAESALGWLQGQPGIKSARLNYDCGSLVIEYDPSFEGILRATLGRLVADELRRIGAPCRPRRGSRASKAGGFAVADPGGTPTALASQPAGAADPVADDGVQRQSDRDRDQHAADALQCLSDRVARLAGVAA